MDETRPMCPPTMSLPSRRARGRRWPLIAAVFLSLLVLVAGPGGAAESAEAPTLDDGDILVADPTAGAIIRVNPRNGAQTVFASGGLLVAPRVVLQSGRGFFVADRRCCGFGEGGILRLHMPTGGQEIVAAAPFVPGPTAMAQQSDGTLLVGVVADLQIVRVFPFVQGPNVFPVLRDKVDFQVFGMAITQDDVRFTSDTFDAVALLDRNAPNGFRFLARGGELRSPRGIIAPLLGLITFTVTVADADCCGGGGGLIEIDLARNTPFRILAGGQFVDPDGVTIDPDGFYLVADPNAFGGNGGVIRVDPRTGAQTVVSSGGGFQDPSGIIVYRNQPPVLVASGGDTAYVQDGPGVVVDPGMVVGDDSASFGGGTVTALVAANATADDRLEIQDRGTGPGQIGVAGTTVTFGGVAIGTVTEGRGTAPLTVSLTGAATPPVVQALLRAIAFRVASAAPSTARRIVRFVVDDGRGGSSVSAPAERGMTVATTNGPPAQVVPGLQTTAANVPLVFSAATRNAIAVSDPDAGAADLRTTLAVRSGTLALGPAGQAPPLTRVTGNGTATVVVQGTAARIAAALDGLTFTPAVVGSVTLTVTTDDLGNTGLGGPLAVTSAILIDVQPAIQLPQAQPQKPPDDDGVQRRLESPVVRLQRERTNRSGRDDVANEGNVLETGFDDQGPYFLIANRDGVVRVRPTGAAIFTSVQVGDYVQIDGEKVNEQLYIATDVTVTGR